MRLLLATAAASSADVAAAAQRVLGHDPRVRLLAAGGLYVIDDLLPQATWPPGHAPRVPALLDRLEQRRDLVVTRLRWASGLAIATRRPQ